ncbi:branched-chain alpha-ketoacid dehydrogenase [Cyathus striatus]|nr:branched-chain alpha-ketoacid dehydrogenase [Cyathus striatus]
MLNLTLRHHFPQYHKQPHIRYRNESTALHFYQNRQLELYASRQAKRLTLRQLVFFGRSLTDERLITSANYVRTELPVRIAHRIRDLQALPYVVVTQEGVAKVYELYWTAFEKFRQYPKIASISENRAFCNFLGRLLDEHATIIPNLTLGLSLSSPYLPPEQLDSFMRRMLVSRISRRVLAEHHIALSEAFLNQGNKSPEEPHVGIIFTGLDVKRSIEKCARLARDRPFWIDEPHVTGESHNCPEVTIDGHLETKFSYIKEHLEYIVFELLKNAMRATVRQHSNSSNPPSIQATIIDGANDIGIRISDQGGGLLTSQIQFKSPSDIFSFSHLRNATRLNDSRLGALRSASSSTKGVKATMDEQVETYKEGDVLSSCLPQIGIGLPMSYIYATYFGGSLELVSLDGWGTDAYLRLPKLGTNLEGIEV